MATPFAGEQVEKRNCLDIVGGNVKRYSRSGKAGGSSFENYSSLTVCDGASPWLGYGAQASRQTPVWMWLRRVALDMIHIYISRLFEKQITL